MLKDLREGASLSDGEGALQVVKGARLAWRGLLDATGLFLGYVRKEGVLWGSVVVANGHWSAQLALTVHEEVFKPLHLLDLLADVVGLRLALPRREVGRERVLVVGAASTGRGHIVVLGYLSLALGLLIPWEASMALRHCCLKRRVVAVARF